MLRILIAAMLLTSMAAADELDHKASIQQMTFLAGAWAETKDGVTVEEHWVGPVGGIMAGLMITHSSKVGAKTSVETMTIEIVDEKLVFMARLAGQPPVSFTQKKADNGIITFENLEHDFPQRVTYEIAGDMAHLIARIDGTVDGKPQSVSWTYKKIAQ